MDKWRAVYTERCTYGSGESLAETYHSNVKRRGWAYLTSGAAF